MGQNSLEEMEQPSWSTKESSIMYLGAISKMTELFLFIFKANDSIIQVYVPTSNAEEAEIDDSMKT